MGDFSAHLATTRHPSVGDEGHVGSEEGLWLQCGVFVSDPSFRNCEKQSVICGKEIMRQYSRKEFL